MDLRDAVQQISRTATHRDARHDVDALLRQAVGYEFAAFSTVDPATGLWTSCYVSGLDESGSAERERTLFELEFSGDINAFAALAASDIPVATLHAATGGVLPRARRWAPLLEGLGVVDEARAVLRVGSSVWGTCVLYRAGTSHPFAPTELAVLTSALPDIARLVRLTVLRLTGGGGGDLPSPPGGFTVLPDGSLTDVSASARAWLDALDDRRRIPSAIRCVAAAARSRPDAAVVSVPGRAGGFVTLYGSRVERSDNVSVIIEPARSTVINEMFTHTHRLTTRERQVAREAALGKTTRDIARTLGISPFTVGDHLKALYAKAGVSSRIELVAALNNRQHDTRAPLAATRPPIAYLDHYIAAAHSA